MASRARPSTINVPPLPEKLRHAPQSREVGPGKRYANNTAFEADRAAWEEERRRRRLLMAERERAQKQVRETRRERQRPVDDSERRVRQRQQQRGKSRVESVGTPTIPMFFRLANLTWLVQRHAVPKKEDEERLWSAWEELLGRQPPPSSCVHYTRRRVALTTLGGKIPIDMQQVRSEKEQRITELKQAGVKDEDLELHWVDSVYIGAPSRERHRGVCLYLDDDENGMPASVSCYDGGWNWDGTTHWFEGEGFVKFSNGDHSVGIWHKFQLMEGFHVEGPRKLEVVRSRTAMGYIQKGQPGMANLVDREWGCANEHESMGLWAEAAGRMPDSGDSDFTDDLLLDWRASTDYQAYCHQQRKFTMSLWCVSQDIYTRLTVDEIRTNNITCEGFQQIPYDYHYDAHYFNLCRTHKRASELRAMEAKVERVQQELLDMARARYRPELPSQQELERRQASIQRALDRCSSPTSRALMAEAYKEAAAQRANYVPCENAPTPPELDELRSEICSSAAAEIHAMLPIEVLMMAPDEDEKLVAAFANQCRPVRS